MGFLQPFSVVSEKSFYQPVLERAVASKFRHTACQKINERTSPV